MADAAADGILDMVNSHRVSGAEGALESALVKYPTHKGLQVAEALILLKLGNLDAATRKANALVECDLAPRYSETLIYVLKKCCSWEPLITMYKKALTRVKNPMETQENMFHAYIRMEKYSDAQALATQLHQSFPSPQYIMWRVQCMLAQVPEGSKDNILLKLATKMLDSALADERMRRPAAVRTYIDVLVQQELFTEALKVLCSSLGSSVGLLMTRLELATSILRKLGHTALANAVAKANWKRNPDNWVPFTAYMETLDASNVDAAASAEMCSISLESNVAELRAVVDIATADASLEAAVQLATELQEAELRDRPRKLNRGPFMAELALLEKLGDEKKLNHAVMLYVQRFYRCPTCYLDVSTFLTADGAGEVHAWASCEDTQADGGEVGRHVQRILGLRCLVASWGITAATQPTEAEMSATMDECIRRYHESAHLSKNLEWSEEGLCDGYISVALNIALRGYVASPENRRLMWVSRGLELLHKVSRLLNNPTWLYFSICFANVMRLADTVAFGQLSFRSMQMDTMTHVGYWPIIGGLALDEVNVWEHEAMERRRQLEEDVSSIRSKIFTYFSWPAMAGLKAFIFKQRNSFALVLSDATYCLKELRECQSQKSILGVMAIKGRTLATVVEKLQQTTLVDNTDWATTRALILGNIHSEEVSQLAEKAVGVPSMDFRREYGLRLAYSLLLLHDLAALVGHQHALKQAPKPSKKNKMAAETSIPPPTLHLPALLQSSTPPVFFDPVRTMADSLIPLITKDTSVTSASNTAQLGQQLMELASRTDSHGLETFLFPESILVMSILTVCTALCAPLVKQWCAGTTEAMELATAKVSSDEWPTTGMSAEELQSAPRTQSLRQAKRKSMQHLLENFSRTTAALMRLK